jgi:hypothetical protein
MNSSIIIRKAKLIVESILRRKGKLPKPLIEMIDYVLRHYRCIDKNTCILEAKGLFLVCSDKMCWWELPAEQFSWEN